MNDKPLKHDVLIHYDEEKNEIAFYTLDVAATAKARAGSFNGARVPIDELVSDGPDEAERRLGSAVLSLLDAFGSKKIGVRDYLAEAEGTHQDYVDDLKERAAGGDSEADFHLAFEELRLASAGDGEAALMRAEAHFTKALEAGVDQAKQAESTWPRLIASARRRLSSG